MKPELRPSSLPVAAKQLDIDPFELVRLMVAAGQRPRLLELSGLELVQLADFAGIERWWDDAPPPPDDPSPARAKIRATVDGLLSRRLVGTRSTRKDNLWRGRPEADRRLLEDAVDALVDQGLLVVEPHVRGTRVAVHEDAVERLERFVAGDEELDALQRLWS